MSKNIDIDLDFHDETLDCSFNICTKGELNSIHRKTIMAEIDSKLDAELEKIDSRHNTFVCVRVIISHFKDGSEHAK